MAMFLCCLEVGAQEDWDDVLDSESLVDDDGETAEQESVFDILSDYAENPLDINSATPEELEQFPFLTPQDVESISEYIYFYGEIKSIGELAMIPTIDQKKLNLLKHFITINYNDSTKIPTFKNIMRYGKHQIMATMKIPTYKRKGDNGAYKGDALRHSLRYDFTYGDRVRVGAVGSKMAGEPFFKGVNAKGYDFYSFYARVRKMGVLNDLIVGRYRVRFGAGLVVNNDFTMGKLGQLASAGKIQNHLSVHSSTNTARYMQGFVTNLKLTKTLDITAFASYRYFDATLNPDGSIATILKSSYHRTDLEISRKNNTTQTTFGGHLAWRYQGLRLGATVAHTSLSRSLQPNTDQVYRRYYPAGRSFTNASIDYSYVNSRFTIGGETAIDKTGKIATLNSINYKFSDELSAMLLQRFYSKKYQALLAQSFSEGGAMQNESGLYFGLTWKPLRGMVVTAYTDYAYFAWPKYQASLTSRAWDNLLMVEYKPNNWRYILRYRLKLRQRDNADKSELVYKNDHSLRGAVEYAQTNWSDRLQGDFAYSYYKVRSRGWMVSNKFYISPVKWAKIQALVGYFHTDDYNARIYSYENGLRYNFNNPSYYGKGMRYALLLQASPLESLSVAGRVTTTKYFDRSIIGSGNQEIDGSSQTELELQVVYSF